MDNQHTLIKGYRDLSESEIALMNEIKEIAAQCGALVEKLRGTNNPQAMRAPANEEERKANIEFWEKNRPLDQRWVSIGATDLQTGFMALVRSVAQPTSF